MSIVLQSSGGGSVTVQEPTTASNFTATLPAATGDVMVSGNMPAFSAYQSSAQSVSQNTDTLIQFQTETFDTNNNFASNTFTPTVAGYYQISSSVRLGSAGNFRMQLFKNGVKYAIGTDVSTSCVSGTISCLVYLNGSTDYVNIYINQNAGNPTTLSAAATDTWFTGCLVRSA